MVENNNFEFNGQHYMHVDSMAIGSRPGKNHACSYMRKWDEQLLKLPHKRYIDVGIGIWTDGEKSLLEFANRAFNTSQNKGYPQIRIESLDTWVDGKDRQTFSVIYTSRETRTTRSIQGMYTLWLRVETQEDL